MGDDEGRYAQGGTATPPVGDVERPPSRHERPHLAVRLPKELGSLRRDLEHHLGTRQPVFGVAGGVPSQESLAAVTHWCFRAVVGPSDKAVQRRRVPCTDFPHGFVLLSRPSPARRYCPYLFYSSCPSSLA